MSCYTNLKKLVDKGFGAVLITVLKGGHDNNLSGKKILLSGGEIVYNNLDRQISDSIINEFQSQLTSKANGIFNLTTAAQDDFELFVHVYEQIPRLLIFGGGHVGAAICRIAEHLDFEIIIVDDRQAFSGKKNHPQAHRSICESFDQAFDLLRPGPSDYLIIVTRGHQHDLLCLKKSLAYQTAYLGMIGSRKRVRGQLEALELAGYSPERLAAVHTPIGLDIGAVTEPEIAISILAEIIQVRRSLGKDESYKPEVLEELTMIENKNKRAVLATIIKTDGSTPRKTGSQMIIAADGSTTGTIGGGFCEGAVIKEALFCLESELSKRLYYNLTADTAAEEGMACGGTMEVYLELL